jgi:hypothetical protein
MGVCMCVAARKTDATTCTARNECIYLLALHKNVCVCYVYVYVYVCKYKCIVGGRVYAFLETHQNVAVVFLFQESHSFLLFKGLSSYHTKIPRKRIYYLCIVSCPSQCQHTDCS